MRVLVDCDPGIDDALALYALLGCPAVDVAWVTTVFGNVTVKQASRNVLRLLALLPAALHPQVGEGSEQPLTGSRLPKRLVHGHDGLGDLDFPPAAVRAKIQDASAVQRQLGAGGVDALVALGPLTNIARYFAVSAASLRRFQSITVMAGVLAHESLVTEFNLASDPAAARCLLGGRLPLQWIPLAVAQTAAISREQALHFESSCAHSRLGQLISRMLLWAIDRRGEGKAFAFADAVAAAVAVDPSLGHWALKRLAVEGRVRSGRLRVEGGIPNANVCQAVNAKAVTDRLFKSWKELVRKVEK